MHSRPHSGSHSPVPRRAKSLSGTEAVPSPRDGRSRNPACLEWFDTADLQRALELAEPATHPLPEVCATASSAPTQPALNGQCNCLASKWHITFDTSPSTGKQHS